MTRLSIWVFLLVILGAGCQKYIAVSPRGFAAYDDGCPYRAVNAEGVMFLVRTEENQPEAKLEFWREALKKRMQDAGYVFVADSEIKANQHPGYLLELAAPVGQQDFAYAIALFVAGSHLVIVESAGEVVQFKKQRQAILEAVQQLQIKSSG